MMKDNNEEKNETELLRKVQFIGGSKYEGTWNTINQTDIGRYTLSHKVILEGEFRNGAFHGHGSMYWPRGQIVDGVWNYGRIKQKRYTFADGLSYGGDEWDYCTSSDRRFYNCILNGLRPAGKTLKTNTEPTKIIPPFCYDTGFGIFDPDNNCIISYRNCKKILKIPMTTESTWIKETCRKGWSEPTGYRAWLHEYWISGTAGSEELLHILPDSKIENWWQRFDRI